MNIINNTNNNIVKFYNLCSYSKDILCRYYTKDLLDIADYEIIYNIILIKNINQYIFFDKEIIIDKSEKNNKNNLRLIKNLNEKHNPNLLKILSMYYNLSDISFNYNNNVCMIENNDIKEFIYFDSNLIEKKKYKFYKVLYENQHKIYETAFLIQIGNWNTFLKILHYIDILSLVEANFYVTIIEEEASNENIELVKNKLKNSVILKVRNKGMDIGPFLLNLLYIRNKNINHKFIVKIHTKTDDRFREHVLNHLIGSESIILNNILKLNNNKELGMLTGTLIFNTLNNNSFFNNHIYYLRYLSNLLLVEDLERSKLEFAIGTFFYSKFEIFNIFNDVNIRFIYNKLNDLDTLDLNWYSIFYNLDTQDQIIIKNHYNKYSEKNYKNNLDFQNKTGCSGMRDFMIEHALERFFGYLCRKNNLTMIEV